TRRRPCRCRQGWWRHRLPELRSSARRRLTAERPVFFWFIASAVFTVFFVFRSPAFDYRPLMVGSLIPLVSVRVLHSLVFSVVFLAAVMLATVGHRLVRRRLLGLPVGTMLHLVFTGAWTNDEAFLWPLFGWDIADA